LPGLTSPAPRTSMLPVLYSTAWGRKPHRLGP
jgi:hypothetical protein